MGVCWEPPFYTWAMQAPTCSAEQTLQSNACNTIQGLGLRVWGVCGLLRVQVFKEILGLGCGRCRNMLEPLPAFFGVCRVPQGGGLYAAGSFSQEAESTVTFENCTVFKSFGCIREPFGQRRVGELKASFIPRNGHFRAELRIWGGCQVGKT